MLLRVKNLSKSYKFKRHLYLKTEEKLIFKDLSFELDRGENLLLCGESGCGKSTVAKILAMLERPNSGEIFFNEKNLLNLNFEEQRALRKELSYVFQEQKLALNPHKRVLDLCLAVYENFNLKPNLKELESLFETFDLDFSLAKLRSNALSTGQAQRIGLIRSLLLKPKLLILDEFNAPLDLLTSKKCLSYLLSLQDQTSYIFISHQESLLRPFCKKELKLNKI